MDILFEKIDCIEKCIDSLPNINWSKYVKGTILRNISEYQDLLDIIRRSVDEIEKYIRASFEEDRVNEALAELKRLRSIFSHYSLLIIDQSSEQEIAIRSMKEIVGKFKKNI